MNLLFSEEPTEQGDQVARVMRAYYDANRSPSFLECVFGKRSSDPYYADNLMIGLANIAVLADRQWRAAFASGTPPREDATQIAAEVHRTGGPARSEAQGDAQ